MAYATRERTDHNDRGIPIDWRWDSVENTLAGGEDNPFYFYAKRCLDAALSAALLVLFAPLMGFVALLIKLDSPGPVFFVQKRVGARRRFHDGRTVWEIRTFPFYKFRSMVHNADPALHREYIKAFIQGRVDKDAAYKLSHDPRITRIGRILRSTSLDELPQLLNVLKGHMSLVGPRPVPTYEVAEYRADHYRRLTAQPGITGIWQTQGRCQVPFEDMVRMDIDYIRRRSLWLDLKLLLLTVPAVLSGHGAK